MSVINVLILDPRAQPEHVGMIPDFLSLLDPRKAAEQFNERYAHGGGWHHQPGYDMDPEWGVLKYPGDPPFSPLAAIPFREELILIYEAGIVAIVQPDKSFEVCRMD
jgi:hypothetical protein